MFKRWFGRTMLKILGWKIIGNFPADLKKFIIIQAPHTSNWDYIVGNYYNFAMDLRPRVIIKKELFVFPLNLVLKSLGGIPINRKASKGFVEQMVDHFNEKDFFRLTITPEGTRKKNGNWKNGFLRIAYGAKQPIVLSFIDYEKKEIGVLDVYQPTFDFDQDMKNIKNYYRDIKGKIPENFSIDANDVLTRKK